MDNYTSYKYMPYSQEEWRAAYVKDNFTFVDGGEWFEDKWIFTDGVIYCDDNGIQTWYKNINGKILQHNTKGPAEYYYKSGKVKRIFWYYEGVKYNKIEFDKIINFLEKRKRNLLRRFYKKWYCIAITG